MAELQFVKAFDQIKTLSDPRRLAILRLLMAEPATITHLGRLLGEHPAWIRHHMKRLEAAGLVELSEVQATGGYVEKFYRARAGAFLFQEVVLPQSAGVEPLVLFGSHDLALTLLSERLHLIVLPVGSLDGLVALRQGLAHLTGCHLLDTASNEYNLPYVRHFFPDRPVAVLTLAHRIQGLLLASGNPRQLRSLAALARPDVILANRNKGSGTRLWLDRQLERLGIPFSQVRGYDRELPTHTAVAAAIAAGQADLGLGLEAAARQFNLDFIPLFQERYDLVIPQEQMESPRLQPMLDLIQSGGFRRSAGRLAGYETSHMGEPLAL